MDEKETKRLYEMINGFWKSIKGGDREAVFCIEIAKFLHYLKTADSSKDDFWSRACAIGSALTKKWEGDPFKEQVIYTILKAADTTACGRRK